MKVSSIFKLNDGIKKRQEIYSALVASYTPKFQLSDNSTYVGIEVEVENTKTTDHILLDKETGVALWANIEDGSLRNNGREFVSIPVSGSMIEFSLNKLHEFLTTNKYCYRHEFSHRTSVHVHVDMSDMTTENIASLLVTYLFVEPFLYNYAGGDRDVNIFTVPLNDCHGYIYDISQYLNNYKVPDYLYGLVRRWDKYTGMNLIPLVDKNTIEFRQMSGNIDVNKLLSWLDSLLQLKLFAQNNKYKDIIKTISDINTTSEYNGFVRRIFSKNPILCDLFTENLQERLEKTSAFVKSCLYNDKTTDVFVPHEKLIKANAIIKRSKDSGERGKATGWPAFRQDGNGVQVVLDDWEAIEPRIRNQPLRQPRNIEITGVDETPNTVVTAAETNIPFLGDI